MEASLSDSRIFEQLNRSASLSKKVAQAIKDGVVLDKSYIEEQYIQCTKTRISPLAERVLQAFDAGEIKLIYTKAVHIPIAVPFVVVELGGKPTACIFIADFSAVSKDGSALTIEMKKLYALMEGAYVALKYFTRPEKFTRNSAFAKLNAQIYSSMVMRLLNREYALSLEKEIFDGVNFISAYFFLEKILGITNKEVATSYATSCCNNPSLLQIQLVKDGYENANVRNVDDLIKFIATQAPKMENLSFRYFFERWISSFGQSACLSIDSYPYLYFTIINVLLGAFLVNVAGLSEIVKNAKGINSFYAEIASII